MGTNLPSGLITNYATDSAYTMAYHTIYANMCFNWDKEQKRQRAILITTPTDDPGCLTATSNIAIASAQSGTPTVLVDAHLQKPKLYERFPMHSPHALSDLLKEDQLTGQTVGQYAQKTFIPHLSVLCESTAIIANSELDQLFMSRLKELVCALRQFLQESVNQAGLIVFNSAPVLAGIETSLLSVQMDETFLAVAAGRTTRAQAKKAQEQLARAHTQLAGVIIVDI